MMPLTDTAERVHDPSFAPPTRRCNFRARLAIITATVTVVVALILLFSPNFQPTELRSSPLGSDFLQEWTGGYLWLSGNGSQLYDAACYRSVQHDAEITGFVWPEDKYYPMVYPPFYYVLVSPLARLSYQHALTVWLVLLGLIAASTVLCFTQFFGPARKHWAKCLLALLAFYPFLLSLNMAQKSILLLLILCLTYLLLFHQRKFAAGAVFGLIAFKPHLGLFIGLVMLLKGQWRFVAGAASTVSVLLGLSLVAGPDACRDYFWQCLSMGDYSQNGGYQLYDAQNLGGSIEMMSGGRSPASWVIWLLTTVLVLAMSLFTVRGPFNFQSRRFSLQYSSLVVATILLSPHFYTYDLTILLLPLALVALAVVPASQSNWSTDSLPISIRQQRWLWALGSAIFIGSGLVTGVAKNYQLQPMTFLLVGALVCLASITFKSRQTASIPLAPG